MAEESFGDIAVKHGFISRDQLRIALEEQRQRRARGEDVLLGRILLDRGYLTPDTFLKLLQLQEKLIKCPKCRTPYNIVGQPTEEKIRCVECGAQIVLMEVLEGILVEEARRTPAGAARLQSRSSGGSGLALVLFLLLVGGAVGFYFMFADSGSRPTPAPNSPHPPVAQPPKPPSPPKSAPPVSEAYRRALEFEKANPNKPEEALALFRKALDETPDPDAKKQIAADLERVQKALEAKIRQAQASLQREVDFAVSARNFGKALELLDAAANTVQAQAWAGWIDAQRLSIRRLASQAFEEIESRAGRLQAEGKFDEAAAVWKTAEALGIKEYAERAQREQQEMEQAKLEAARRASEAAAKKVEEEKQAYPIVWQEIVELAMERRYDDAVARARAWAEAVSTPELKKEAEEDLADVRAAWSVLESAVTNLSKLRKGEDITIEYVKDGKPVQATGKVQATTESGIVLEGGEYIKVQQMAASTILRLYRMGKPDDKALALFCLFERVPVPEGVKAQLRSKYLDLAKKAERPEPGPAPADTREKTAAQLFRDAEREWLAKDKSPAVHKYDRLLKEFATTGTVKSNLKRISERAAFAREIVINAADFTRISGKWSVGRDLDAPISKILHSPEKDRDPATFNPESPNFVETSVTVISGVKYKIWVQLGYDCTNNDSMYLQIEDARDEKGGGAVVIERKWSTPTTHGSHDETRELKRKWNWTGGETVEFATGGTKRLRVYLREDGAAFTQIVLTTQKWFTAAPDQDFVTPPK